MCFREDNWIFFKSKEASKFQGCFKDVVVGMGVLRVFQGCFKIFNDVLREFQGQEKLHGYFKKVTRKIEGCLWEFKGISRKFQGCFMKDLCKRKFNGCFRKSFMLHGTHHSFPSSRRACFLT